MTEFHHAKLSLSALDSSRRLKFLFVQGLTLVRMPLIFLFLAVSVFCRHPVPEPWFIVAFTAMILSAVTDLLDGYFARRFGVTSRLGSYADPMMDKIFYLTTFPTVVYLADRIGQHLHAMGQTHLLEELPQHGGVLAGHAHLMHFARLYLVERRFHQPE